MGTQTEILRLIIEATGIDQLIAPAKALMAIADAGGPAAASAQTLLEKLATLASQNQLIDTLLREKIALQETGDALALQKLKLAELQTQMAATSTPSAALERSFAKTQTTIATLDAAYNSHQANLTRTSNALLAAGVDTEHLDSAQRDIRQTLANTAAEAQGLGKNLGSVAAETANAGAKAEEAGGLFAGFRGHLAEIISIAAAAEVALKGVEFGSESLKRAEDVEASLARVKALAGDAELSFEGMDEAIDKAARDTNSTTEVAASGLAALAAQGLNAEHAVSALVPTLQLAKIANIDVATAAAEVAATLKAFDEPASEAQRVVDQLTAASHGAAGGLGAMTNAAVQLAPDAKALGINFTALVSILGLLSSKGFDVEKSVRGLRTVFQELQDPTSKIRGELLALGDGTNDFGKAVAALTSGTPRASQALLSLSGPARTLIELLGQAGPGAIGAFNAKLEESQGVAAKTRAAIDDTFRGAATSFGNAIDFIGEKLVAPVLRPFADELNKLAGELNAFADSKDFEEIKAAVKDMATDAAKSLDEFINGVNWKKFGDDAKAGIKDLKDDLDGIAQSTSTVASVVGKSADVVGVAYHALGLGVSVAVGVAAAAVEDLTGKTDVLDVTVTSAAENIGKHWEKLKDDALDLSGASEKAADSTKAQAEASQEAAPKVTELGEALVPLPDYMGSAAQSADELATATKTVVPYLAALSTEAIHLGGGPLTDARQRLRETTQALADLQLAGNATPAAMAAASQAFVDASRKLDQLQHSGTSATGALVTALEQLKVTSQDVLQKHAADFKGFFEEVKADSDQSAAGIANVRNAFLAYAQARLAATAQLDAGTRAAAQADLEQQAAVLGISDALTQLEQHSQEGVISDADRAAAALQREADQADRLAQRLGGGGGTDGGGGKPSVTSSAADANKAIDGIGKSANQLNEEISNINTGGFTSLVQAVADTRAQFVGLSQAAADFFDYQFRGDFIKAFDSTGVGFEKVEDGMAAAAKATNDEITKQRQDLQGVVDATNKVGTESVEDFAKLGGTAKYTETQLDSLIKRIQAGTYETGLLGQQELQPLLAALQAAKERVDALKAASEEAKQQLADMGQQLQDDLDRQQGNQEAIEQRRYEKQLADLKAAATTAGELNSTQYRQDVDNANKLHALKMQQLEQQASAQKQSTQQQDQQAGGGSSSAAGANNGGIPANVAPIHIHVGDQQFDAYGTPNQAQMLAAMIRTLAAGRANSIIGL